MSFAMRPAATGISVPGAADLSPRRHRWALQTCRHTVFRLRLAYVAPIPGMTTGSGYAEESRCHADAARLIPGLARRAVAALLDQNRPR